MGRIVLEICVDSPASAAAAQQGGADRVELCSALDLGGLTPSQGLLRAVVRESAIPVNVLVRPRQGDFYYDAAELAVICEDIRTAAGEGAAGIVCGALDMDGNIDMRAMEAMMRAAGGLPVTFHRAFDVCAQPFEVLEQLRAMGVATVLTSGQAATAAEGLPTLAELQRRAAGAPVVMAGCGLNSENIARVASQAGLGAVHLSARAWVASPVRHRVQGVAMGTPGASEYDYRRTDPAEVAACRRALDEI